MSAQDMERVALERQYLRLLRCYPPSHREVHGEEMLGVLLDAARPGQRTPGLRQTVNLAACGLMIRAHRIPGWLTDGRWQDALAVVSLIAPAVMFIVATLDFATAVQEAVNAAAMAPIPVSQLLSFVPLVGGPAVVMMGWLAVVLLGLLGRRRAAAAIALIPLALSLVNLLVVVLQLSGAWTGGLPLFLAAAGLVGPVVTASLAACSLAFSGGPRLGLAIVGRRQACLMIVGLSVGFEFPVIVALVRPAGSLPGSTLGILGVLAIAAAAVVASVRSTVDRRVAVLVVTALVLDLAYTVPREGDLTGTVVLLLVNLLVAVLVWPLAIVSWRRRIRRASRAAAG